MKIPKGDYAMTGPVMVELKKLTDIATDMDLTVNLRKDAIKSLGQIGTHEALLALLELVAEEKLNPGERKLALQQAEKLIK
jgi:HEAT repeat protein